MTSTLTARDRKTILYAGIAIGLYLLLFFGFKTWKRLEQSRAEHQRLLARVQSEQQEARNHENRALLFEKLSAQYRLDPRKLPQETLVAEASAAIQAAARQDGFELGPVRETPGRASGRELSTIQFDGLGPVSAALGLAHKLQSLGFPILVDSLQLTPEPQRPGMLKLNITLVILNYAPWKNAGGPNA